MKRGYTSSCSFFLLLLVSLEPSLLSAIKQGSKAAATDPCCPCCESSASKVKKEASSFKQEAFTSTPPPPPPPPPAPMSLSAPATKFQDLKYPAGSRPPSCYNKCASCTPCQLVKAAAYSQQEKIGSAPPSCRNKCNSCVPCRAVQAPMSTSPESSSEDSLTASSSTTLEPTQATAESDNAHFTVGFSNYKPETWKCKCGSKLFSP